MGYGTPSIDAFRAARAYYHVTSDRNVTRRAEQRARDTGHLNEIVDPGVNPLRCSKIRLNPHQGKWISTLGCPMDIEVSCDTTGSMGGEVDTEMAVLPDLYEAVAKVLPGYDPQLCLGIFGDCGDDFVMCRPQFEMEAPKIVNYLKEMAPQRGGCGNHGEDPQYAMFARAYLTDAYTNHIGLKGYHFIVTDEPYHNHLREEEIQHIFGSDILKNELKGMRHELPSVKAMVAELKKKTHQFILVMPNYFYSDTLEMWRNLCGEESVIEISSTWQLPAVISAIIGLTEGTLDITGLEQHLINVTRASFKRISESSDTLVSVYMKDYLDRFQRHELVSQLSLIDIGAQAKLRHALPHPVPKAGDIFVNKGDTWPIQPGESPEDEPTEASDRIEYL